MFQAIQIKHKKTTLFIAGVLGALGFAPVYALPLFVASLFFAVLMCEKAETYRKVSLFAYLFGVGFNVSAFYWISNALLVDVKTFGLFYPLALLAPGLFFALFWLPPFWAWHFFKKQNVWFQILGFSSVFVLCEYCRSFLLTGFPWNMLGTMFAFSDIFIQTASVIGTYGLTFLLLILGFCFYAAFEKYYKSAVIVFVCVVGFMLFFGVFRISQYDNSSSKMTVRLVQPSIPQSVKWDQETLENNLADYINLSRQDGLDQVDLVVWGETATAFNPADLPYYKMLIKEAVPKNGYLITGLLRYERNTDQLYNSLSVIDGKGETVAFYDKNHLVPFGEYLPFRKLWPQWMKPVANQISDLSKGKKYKNLSVKGLPKFGALICYEIIFADEVLNRKDKPQFLVVVSNDGWYGQSFGPYQHLVSARMRAVEEGVTIVRSANNGISAVINPLGEIVGKIGLDEREIKDFYLPQKLDITTIYSQIGGKSIQYVMLLLLAFLLLKNKLNKRI